MNAINRGSLALEWGLILFLADISHVVCSFSSPGLKGEQTQTEVISNAAIRIWTLIVSCEVCNTRNNQDKVNEYVNNKY